MKIKKIKGFTLIEALLVSGLISITTFGVYSVFNKARDIGIASEEAKIVENFRSEVAKMYENSPSYAGLDNAAVNQSKVTPLNMLGPNANDIINKFGGAVNISPITYSGIANSGFRITYPNIKISSCPHMVLSMLGSFNSITVNGDLVKNYGDSNIDPAVLANSCDDAADPAVGATIEFDYISSFLIAAASAVPARSPSAGTIFSLPKNNTDLVCDIDSPGFGSVNPSPVPASVRSQIIFTFKSIDNYSGRCPTKILYDTWVNNVITSKALNPNPSLTYQEIYTTVVEPLLINDGIYNHTKSTEEALASGFCTTASNTVYGASVPSSYVPGSGNKCKVN
jgi:type II secretory pathway pseudopilin PulG